MNNRTRAIKIVMGDAWGAKTKPMGPDRQLVDELSAALDEAEQRGREQEREACALIAEEDFEKGETPAGYYIAEAIRARATPANE